MKNENELKKLNELFGSYRAEWLKSKIFNLFTEPFYFSALKSNGPCVLQGGRGTGKTTVLRGLSYQGQYALANNSISEFNKANFIGIYHKANTNHVRVFCGGGLGIDVWQKIFAHYFNIVICREILNFIAWHKKEFPEDDILSSLTCKLIANSLHIDSVCVCLEDLLEHIEVKMYDFQSEVNNIADGSIPKLSMPGDPIKIITDRTLELSQFKDKIFYILLDEYENFLDYQQQSLNSLIKHSGDSYTFKIGVRELGWRVKHTLNVKEFLHDPADYVLIDITQKLIEGSNFDAFAKDVCQQRIKDIFLTKDISHQYLIEESLVGLSMEEEAILLKVNNTEVVSSYQMLPKKHYSITEELSPLYKFFIGQWAKSHMMTLDEAILDYKSFSKKWDTRYENYKYNMLFKIRKGRGMGGIQKYYAGWDTYIKLANGNIRYLMELVYRAYEKHLSNGNNLLDPIAYDTQTAAAEEVGKKNLLELEGLWEHGAQLTKLLLGLGRIFNVLISEDVSVAPEINQISITEDNDNGIQSECNDIITAAVMNLALIRLEGNKLSDQSSTKDYLYAIHPIYAPFFVFSHRKKRKMSLYSHDILGIIKKPKLSIEHILGRKNIRIDISSNLPSQLNMFEDFYS